MRIAEGLSLNFDALGGPLLTFLNGRTIQLPSDPIINRWVATAMNPDAENQEPDRLALDLEAKKAAKKEEARTLRQNFLDELNKRLLFGEFTYSDHDNTVECSCVLSLEPSKPKIEKPVDPIKTLCIAELIMGLECISTKDRIWYKYRDEMYRRLGFNRVTRPHNYVPFVHDGVGYQLMSNGIKRIKVVT